MPSSTSSSELPTVPHKSYQREVPAVRLGLAWLIALLLFAAGSMAWELHWRAFGGKPTYQNSNGLWARERRRIDNGEGNSTVIIGSSRVLFDIQLPVWEKILQERPIQLALEGTSPLLFLENLADDPKFTGRLIVGVTPVLFFSGFDRRVKALKYFREETLSQRAGQWISMHLLEPFFAFYQEDFALMTVLQRQPWPSRAGVLNLRNVRKLSVSDADRNTHMWNKVENDPNYRQLARGIWTDILTLPPRPEPEKAEKLRQEQIDRAAIAVGKLRARGVEVVFVRPPSSDLWLEVEQRAFPRAQNWDVLLARTGARGIYYEDYAELRDFTLPEWSHLAKADAERFTEALCRILQREYGWSGKRLPNPESRK